MPATGTRPCNAAVTGLARQAGMPTVRSPHAAPTVLPIGHTIGPPTSLRRSRAQYGFVVASWPNASLTACTPAVTDLLEDLRSALGPTLRVDRELGGGGMARVFVATDPSLERAVVVKVLPPERAAVLSAERFRREILIAAALSHPNIVPVLSAGTADGLLWYSMPFVAGRSLRARIAEGGALNVSEALPILRDVARALAYAHRHGVVHRDVKPDNVLLAVDGAATVTDFGIAKAIDTARTAGDPAGALTQTGNSIGTPHYMAPEQIAGEALIDGRADLYAFGMMAYEMLTGRRPFADRPAAQVLAAHLTEDPAPLATNVPAVPTWLAQLVHRCIAKDPAQRPASADDVIATLDASTSTESQPAVARPRRRGVLAGLGGAALVAAAAAMVWVRGDTPALNPGLIVVAPFRVVDGQGDLAWLREGMLDLLSTKIGGVADVHTVDPRTSLARFRTLGSAGTVVDASAEQARTIARGLGAGRVVLGELLPDARGLALHATVVDAATGAELARFEARGRRDSVVALADDIGAKLLTHLAGKAARSAAVLDGVPLEALRPYLEGSALLRRMRSEAAAEAFLRALDVDSTFALAGLGAVMSMSWYGGVEGRDRAVRAAWNGRTRLPAREQALLAAVLGPRHPARSPTLEVLRAREQLLALAPDSPEAVYLLADHLFHYGPALGIADAMARAESGFRRAVELDAQYLVGSEHLLEMAVARGDEPLTQRLTALRRGGVGTFNAQIADWHSAMRRNDTSQLRLIEDSSAASVGWWVSGLFDRALAYDVGLASIRRITRASLAHDGPPAVRQLRQRLASRAAFLDGATTEAITLLRASGTSPDDPMVMAELVRLALLGAGDSTVAREALQRLAPLDAAPLTGTDSIVVARREATRAIALWRVAGGDTSTVERDVARLRAAFVRLGTPADVASGRNLLDVHIETLEALRAAQRDSASARMGRERLHAALDSLDWSGVTIERTVALSLIASRLFEAAGDLPRALQNAARDRVRNGDVPHPYLRLQRRTVERLRARLGRSSSSGARS